MADIIIIGNSGAARECHALFQEMLCAAPGLQYLYKFKGFLSWQNYSGNLKGHNAQLLGDAETYPISNNDLFVIGIAAPALRRAVYENLKKRGASFLTLIHPWSEISPEATIGEGNIFQRGSTVYCDSIVGNANYFNGAINLAHDVTIGDYNFIGPASLILGGCTVGNENSIGVHSVLLPKASIGNSNIIAPGSIVYKGCKDNCRLAGNPALDIS